MKSNCIILGSSEIISSGKTLYSDTLTDAVSISERACLLPPFNYRGISIHILDESSRMHTGSFKALTAQECISDCLKNGLREICFTSGANTGMALAAYGNRAGIKTHFFIPAANVWKLDARYVMSPKSHIYAVDDPSKAKVICEEFARKNRIAVMPKLKHRMIAARRRGSYIRSLIQEGIKPDWFVQTVCAGFGPIGIYSILTDNRKSDQFFTIPRFLGVQQAGNCSLAEYLQSINPKYTLIDSSHGPSLVESTFYDKNPQTYGTFASIQSVVEMSRGAVIAVAESETIRGLFDLKKRHPVHEFLNRHGIVLGIARQDRGELQIVQKAGLLAIAGIMEAERAGLLVRGQEVLCSLSGGATKGIFTPLPDNYPLKFINTTSTEWNRRVKLTLE